MQTGSGALLASCPVGTGVLSLGIKQWGVKLISHFPLVPSLRMGGVVPVLPSWLYTGTTFTFICYIK